MRARLSLALAVVATLFGVASARARTFYVVRSGSDAWTVMDAGGIEQVPGSPVRKAWSVTVQRNILSAGLPPQPGYVRTLNEYDCLAGRTRWMTFSAFSRGGGLLVTRQNPTPDWGPADEAGDMLSGYRVVCQGGGGAVVAADSLAKVVISLMAAWDPPPPVFAAPGAASAKPAAQPKDKRRKNSAG